MLGKIKDGKLVNNYAPHYGQEMIHNDNSRFRVCVCGRRFGKTTFALNELYMQAWGNTDPLARCWYVAPNYRQAKTVAWEMLKETVPEQVIEQVNEAELSIRLKNGSLLELKGADSQDSLRGAKLKFVVLDEYASMRSTVWDEVIRPAMADVRGSRALFIGTPAGFNHFKIMYEKGLGSDLNFRSFRFKTLDNPYVDSKEIEEIKLVTTPAIFRQEYEASFEQMAGSIYPMFKRENHVIKPQVLHEEWDRVVAMDWGMRNATAVLFAALSPEGEIYIYDMAYSNDKTVSQWAQILKTRYDYDQISSWVIDPSALAQAKEFGQYGIFFHSYNPETTKRINDVNIGINLVSQYFLEAKVKIFDHCETLIQELEQYQWEPTQSKLGAEAKAKPLKKDDHSCFIAGTKVLTMNGIKDIETITENDLVLTRKGYRSVEYAGSVGEKETKAYLFSNGSILIGTKDHPIFVDNKKMKLDSLRYFDKIDSWIIPTSIVRQGIFGVKLLARSLKDIISTIRIMIGQIMPQKILLAYPNMSMNLITENLGPQISNTLKKLDLSPLNGIDQKKEANGIGNMGLNVGVKENQLKEYVRFVIKNLEQKIIKKPLNFVQTIVKCKTEGILKKILSKRNVLFVSKCLKVINTILQKLVLAPVPRFLGSIPWATSRVYNLQINGVHEYYANGLCVSNCDALRYLVMTRPKGKELKKEKYKNLDSVSEQFWRTHFKEMPKDLDFKPNQTILFGIDEDYGSSTTEDLW